MADTASYTNGAATAAISAVPGALLGAVLEGGSSTANLILHDNATAGTGTVLLEMSVIANTTAVFPPGLRLPVSNGIYATLSCSGTPNFPIFYTP